MKINPSVKTNINNVIRLTQLIKKLFYGIVLHIRTKTNYTDEVLNLEQNKKN